MKANELVLKANDFVMKAFPRDRQRQAQAKPAVRKISVVTVCLNARDSIRLTLESVARQTFESMEHVIIDGGSTDGTCDIVREYPVGHFVSEKDKGVYDAMDKGARAASGDVLIFLNAGDTFYDDRCCEDVAAFFDETGTDIVFGNLMPVYLDSSDTHDHGAFTAGTLLDLSYVVNRRQLYDESLHHQATFYRRWIFDKCTYTAPEAEATGEYNLLLDAVMTHKAAVKHIPRAVSRFVLGGISTRSFETEWANYIKARDILRSRYFPKGQHLRVRDELEFVHRPAGEDDAQRSLARRVRAKEWLKHTPFFKGYDRLMRSQSARTSNTLFERLEGTLAAQTRHLEDAIESARTAARHDQEALQQVTAARAEEQDRRLADEAARTRAQLQVESVATAQRLHAVVESMEAQIARLQVNMAEIVLRTKAADAADAADEFAAHGFRVSSQWNEDGLIQYLIARGQVTNRRFVEFGVGDYRESNTRFLLQKDNWTGLILDCGNDEIRKIRNSELYWRHSLTAVEAFVDADNVNRLLTEHGMGGDIGLLSIDVDGVDYWIWKALEDVSPQIVICEYNGIFGPDAAVTVPYEPGFDRTRKHYSWLYAGASLAALTDLGRAKGYTLVGTSAGNNAFFVRDDVMARGSIKPSAQPFTRPMYRESRDPDGALSYLDADQAIRLISHLTVMDIRRDQEVTIAQACLGDSGQG
ncbi:MAG: glycosyltransferase [Lautropia sp.]